MYFKKIAQFSKSLHPTVELLCLCSLKMLLGFASVRYNCRIAALLYFCSLELLLGFASVHCCRIAASLCFCSLELLLCQEKVPQNRFFAVLLLFCYFAMLLFFRFAALLCLCSALLGLVFYIVLQMHYLHILYPMCSLALYSVDNVLKSGLGTHSFQKNATFLRSVPFFIKGRNNLCVLSRSL